MDQLNWICAHFSSLTVDELYELLQVRADVFVIEQQCIYKDLDDKDRNCYHLLGKNRETITGSIWTIYSLKNSTKEEKALFMTQHKVEFIDLIKAVDVEKPGNYRDDYIDSNVIEWTNVVDELKQLPGLRKVCVTRKTFSGVPNIRKQLQEIEAYCEHNKIRFQYLITPARGYTTQKQEAWNMCFRE